MHSINRTTPTQFLSFVLLQTYKSRLPHEFGSHLCCSSAVAVHSNLQPLLRNTNSTLKSCDSFAASVDILGCFTIFLVQAWTYAIEQSCLNKAAVVAADEREGGVRATLNLGHTFGHAIETGLGYGALPFSSFQSQNVCTSLEISMQSLKRLGIVKTRFHIRELSSHEAGRQHSGSGSFNTNWPDSVTPGWILLIAKQTICYSSNSMCGKALHDVLVLVERHSLSFPACIIIDVHAWHSFTCS